MTAQTSLTRSSYGELLTNSQTSQEHRAMLAAANSNDIFGDAREHRNLIIALVEVSGREYVNSFTGKVKNQPPDLTAGEFNRGE